MMPQDVVEFTWRGRKDAIASTRVLNQVICMPSEPGEAQHKLVVRGWGTAGDPTVAVELDSSNAPESACIWARLVS